MARSVQPGRLLALVAAVALVITLCSGCDPAREGDFITQINQLRTSHGLRALAVDDRLTDVARSWSDQMAAAGAISHNPSLANEAPSNWRKLGENVGVGYDVSSLMQAFINSPAHYANLMDPAFDYVGVGVTWGSDGRMYVTQDFMAA